jgi:DNA replication and repair protein RecF
MRVARLSVRDLRNYERAEVELGRGLTVVVGPNGAGKTNLLEGLYFGCTGRSPRTSNERELVRRGATAARATVTTVDDDGYPHTLEAALQPGEPKLQRVDGAAVDSLALTDVRPLVSVFLPDRLELVKGAPAARRAHLDQLVAALWPARAESRRAYSRTLAQRNALLGRARGGGATTATLASWDAELARCGIEVMETRAAALELLAPRFAALATTLGLPSDAELAYRPRSRAQTVDELAAELAERHAADLERGFTAHGPHRDDVRLLHGGAGLRSFGSQGQQRVGLLALLFAERDLLAAERGRTPLMLLDDVMSELDARRRDLLVALLREGGQAVLTATEGEHVPAGRADGVTVLEVDAGVVAAAGVPA